MKLCLSRSVFFVAMSSFGWPPDAPDWNLVFSFASFFRRSSSSLLSFFTSLSVTRFAAPRSSSSLSLSFLSFFFFLSFFSPERSGSCTVAAENAMILPENVDSSASSDAAVVTSPAQRQSLHLCTPWHIVELSAGRGKGGTHRTRRRRWTH